MKYLLDTNILVRIATPTDPLIPLVNIAIRTIRANGDTLHVCSQSIIEFRAAAIRPSAMNGLGVTSADATAEIARFLLAFPCVTDTSAVFTIWRTFTETTATLGKQNHDARIMAAAMASG